MYYYFSIFTNIKLVLKYLLCLTIKILKANELYKNVINRENRDRLNQLFCTNHLKCKDPVSYKRPKGECNIETGFLHA